MYLKFTLFRGVCSDKIYVVNFPMWGPVSENSIGMVSTWFYFLLHNVFRLCYQLFMAGNFQSAMAEGDGHCLPVTPHSIYSPCQSKQLTSLGIIRWQTVVLLLSTLHIITTMANALLVSSFFCPPGCGSHIHCGTHKTHRWPKVSFHHRQ